MNAAARSAYIHVPFCRHRCGYCNFTLVAGRDDLVERFLAALAIELSSLSEPREVDTLFFGGGTPTHLRGRQLQQLLETAARWHPLAEGGEFSVEANPRDIDSETIDILRRGGVTRLSLGAQSFDPEKLARLERDHGPDDIRRAAELARAAGLQVSLDLIFATPEESFDLWRRDLDAALALVPDHVSTYGLTYEQGTSFWNRLRRGQLAQADEELEREMYLAAIDWLTASGLEHYEVSNFALPGRRCRHNEVYWSGASFFAAGPAAARFIEGRREVNVRSVEGYLQRAERGETFTAESEQLEPEASARELLVFGLRRLAGVDRTWFAARTGFDLDRLGGAPLAKYLAAGLLEDHGASIRLTRAGLLISDALWPDLLVE